MRQWWQQGSPWVWLSASALLLCLALFMALLGLIAVKGMQHFWPAPLVQFQLTEQSKPQPGRLVRQVSDRTEAMTRSLWLVDRGDGLTNQTNAELGRYLLLESYQLLPERPLGAVLVQLQDGRTLYGSQLQSASETNGLWLELSSAPPVLLTAADIRAYWLPNQLSWWQRGAIFWQEWRHFLTASPSKNQSAGGIFPAIFGTLVMVLLMAVLVTPFGILAAIYLHEYAPKNWLTQLIRTSVYNLAGIPSVVMGVFGLAFFVYVLGGSLDRLLFAEQLPAPTFGTPGLFWAALTLALLTLPVVIVATEEGLSRLPQAQRLGSFALGATQAETIWKVVVPQAAPAMLTGLILAIARAAGEVAPLMLVGVVKSAPQLPVDMQFPFIHLERKFMHLGYHLYDVGFQSPDAEVAMSLVYAIGLVLLTLILLLNLSAFFLRQRLRRKYRLID
ncbi:phosphate ABC transporter permease PstA [Alkalimonas amylolytica]|uniref:Phosphate transport system permease protein PstA n=1 Tax=Alkalimonas amylolytica TaxID=152573 RepID=A0A1H4E156_ALKAM|nr:phosphate ABC transporter permease PstA [Alkalimonas amylolytica]SEA78773.1 phosphate transport system permease protein [Alkalimonas amylolytica]